MANQQHDLFTKETEQYKLTLEKIASDHIGDKELIAINGNGNPQELYLSHRKGFVLNNEDLLNETKIKSIIEKGCKYLIVNIHTYNQILNYKVIYRNKDYLIYELED